MSDQGFNFRPPQRREAKRFEPPPWEREQFERHARERAGEEAPSTEAQPDVSEQEAAEVSQEQAEPGATAGRPQDECSRVPAVTGAAVDEKQIALLMLGLRAEEPPAMEGAWTVGLGAGVVVAIVGAAFGIWGAAALARPGLPAAGTLGGVVLLGFGLGFLGIGAWLIFKALRQRGVL